MSSKANTSIEKPTNVRRMIFALACATSFLLYLHRYSWGFIKADVQKEFGWSNWELGLLDGIFGVFYSIGQIPSGILCDLIGPHLLLSSIILLWTVSMGSIALATGFVSAAVYRAVFGLTQAGCYPTLSKVTKLWFPLSARTAVQGWIATFFGRGGGAMSFILIGTVLMGSLGLSWRQALYVLTGFGIVFGLMFFKLFRNRPQDHPWANEAEAEFVAEGKPATVAATGTRLRWSRLAKSPNMMVFFFQQFTSAFADNVYVYWIPLYLLTVKNVDMKGAGWMAALPLAGGAIGGMIGGVLQGYLIQRTGNRRWTRSLIGMIGKLLATIFMFVSLGFESAVVIVGIFALVKFFGDWSQPTVWGTVTDISGQNAATVFGAVNTVGSIASFLAGPLMGLMIMAYSEVEPVASEKPKTVADEKAFKKNQTKYNLEHLSIVEGSLTGWVFSDGLFFDVQIATFVVSESGDFVFTPSGDVTLQPVSSSIDVMRGKVTIGWKEQPRENTHIVVNYEYVDYASGWTALFIALGAIYLASSLSWLLIDCTKKIEDDET